jgi:hypothetical protein
MAWDDDKKAKVIKAYTDAKPTGANSIEIVKQLAEDFGETPNGVRMILSKAEVYVKKEEASGTKKTTTATKEGATARVSKADSLSALIKAVEEVGYTVDNDIIDKLTGKQAIYFTNVIKAALVITAEGE